MMTQTPQNITPNILRFCETIVSNQKPFYVPFKPLPYKPVDECFTIVPEHIIAHGGKQKNGWTIWEWPKVLIEAEFHAIWQTPNDDFVDITPKDITTDKILFLPDSSRKYKEGKGVDNIRKPLTLDKRVRKFCRLQHEVFLAMDKLDPGDKQGAIPIIKINHEMEKLRKAISRKY